MSQTESKRYATRMVKRAEAKLTAELQDFEDGRAMECHVARARRSLTWALAVRSNMNTMGVNEAYEAANVLL